MIIMMEKTICYKGKLPIKRYCHSIRHGQFLTMPFCCSRFDFGALSDDSGGRVGNRIDGGGGLW